MRPIPLIVHPRRDGAHFRGLLEALLNRPLPAHAGPLLHVHYVYAPSQPQAELLLVADHVICDGISMNALSAELLGLAAGAPAGAPRPSRGPLARDDLLGEHQVDAEAPGERVAEEPVVGREHRGPRALRSPRSVVGSRSRAKRCTMAVTIRCERTLPFARSPPCCAQFAALRAGVIVLYACS